MIKILPYLIVFLLILIVFDSYYLVNARVSYMYEVDHQETLNTIPDNGPIDITDRKKELLDKIGTIKFRLISEVVIIIILVSTRLLLIRRKS